MRQFDLSDIHIFLLLSSVGIKRLSCGYYLSQKIDSQKVKKIHFDVIPAKAGIHN